MARSRRGWGQLRKLPSGRYQARYLDPDTREIVPAPETFANKGAADAWLSRKRTELDAGSAVDERAGNKALGDWWPAYWATVQQTKRPRTQGNYSASWRLRVEPVFGATAVRRIKPAGIDSWINEMIEGGTSPAKALEAYGVAKRLLDLAVRDKAIASNPCSERSKALPRLPKMDRPVLVPSEVEKLAVAFATEQDRILVRTLAYSGARIGEILALRWSNVDLDNGTMRIRETVESNDGSIIVGPTKNYETRDVTIPSRLIAQLRTLRDAQPDATLVFPNRNGYYLRYRSWRRRWDKACEDSGITALPHDLRGTAASLLIDSGASVKDVQIHLGHSAIETTLQLYARVRPGRNLDIAMRLDALILEGEKPKGEDDE